MVVAVVYAPLPTNERPAQHTKKTKSARQSLDNLIVAENQKPLLLKRLDDLKNALVQELVESSEANSDAIAARRAKMCSEKCRAILDKIDEKFGPKKAFDFLLKHLMVVDEFLDSIKIDSNAAGEAMLGTHLRNERTELLRNHVIIL